MRTRNHKKFSFQGETFLARGDFVYRHSPVPIFVRSKGCSLTDSDGYQYLDMEAANGTASLGFDATILSESVRKTAPVVSMPSFCETNLRRQVATKLGKLLEQATGKAGKIAFELGGAQAVELAVKIIRCNSKSSQLVVFEGGYHGRTMFTSQLSASHRYRAGNGEWRIPVVRLPYPDFEQFGDTVDQKTHRQLALERIEWMLSSQTAGVVGKGGMADISALIIEPILNAGGIVKPDNEFLETIVSLFRKHGALIVVDEIFCGFHRTGPLFGFQNYSFQPDIVILSKALTNGITPLSCVWARDPLMLPKNFPAGTHSATYVNNTLALAVADTTLDRYASWKNKNIVVKNLEKHLITMVKSIQQHSPLIRSCNAIGGVARLLLAKNVAGEIDDMAMVVARNRPVNGFSGLILASTSLAPNVIAMNPSLLISDKELGICEKILIQTFSKANRLFL